MLIFSQYQWQPLGIVLSYVYTKKNSTIVNPFLIFTMNLFLQTILSKKNLVISPRAINVVKISRTFYASMKYLEDNGYQG